VQSAPQVPATSLGAWTPPPQPESSVAAANPAAIAHIFIRSVP